jgi:hypothetical protein
MYNVPTDERCIGGSKSTFLGIVVVVDVVIAVEAVVGEGDRDDDKYLVDSERVDAEEREI